jgi:hypothetical protein
LAPDTWKYEQLQAAQLIDLNPGTRAGLFWTVPVSDDAVTFDERAGRATLHLEHVGLYDYTDLAAALTSPVTGHPSVASLTVTWVAADLDEEHIDDAANLANASHRPANATIVFSGWHVADTGRAGEQALVPLAFRSGLTGPADTTGQRTPNLSADPLAMADVPWGVIGREQNGIYYDPART